MQWKYNGNTVEMQWKYGGNTVEMQWKYGADAVLCTVERNLALMDLVIYIFLSVFKPYFSFAVKCISLHSGEKSAQWREAVQWKELPLWLWFSSDGSLLTLVTASYPFCTSVFVICISLSLQTTFLFFSVNCISLIPMQALMDRCPQQWRPHVIWFTAFCHSTFSPYS